MNIIIISMFLILLIPIYQTWRDEDIWQRMLAVSSISTKASILILAISVFKDDWMVGVVGVIILTIGNASLMLLAHLLKRLNI